MASLAHCVDLHKTSFPKEEMVALRRESRRLAMEKKIKTKEAMIQVVRSRIAETQVEYDKIANVVMEHMVPEKKAEPKKEISQLDLVKRYVKETGKRVEKGELGKVRARYPAEWAKIEEADVHKKELWDKLPESFRRNRGINEYSTEELEDMVAMRAAEVPEKPIKDKVTKEPAKEPWETSDLADKPNIPASMVQAKKQPDGKYKLFFTGTRNEVFEGKTFESAQEARSFFKVQQVKAQAAKEPAKKPTVTKGVAGQRSNKEGVEFYNPFNVKTRNKIIEGEPSFAGVTKQGFRDGFFTQGHYAIRLPEAPKTKGPLLTGEEALDVKALIPKDMTGAYLIGEFKQMGSVHTFAHAMAPGNQDCFFNADFVDLILTRYPDAKLNFGPMVYEGRLGIFTLDGKVVGLVMSMNVDMSGLLEKIQQIKVKEEDVKFSVAEEKDLVAYHNLYAKDLIASDDLGGMPMPSLAITKKDFPYEPFGDITMVGSRDMVDPEGTFNRVFDADTFSPTVPGKERDLKRKPFDELWGRLSSKIGDVGDYIYSLTEAVEKGKDHLLHHFDNSNGMKVAFLREQGIPLRIPMRDIGFEMPFSDTTAVQDFVKGYKGKIAEIKLHSPEHKALSIAVERGVDEALERDHPDAPDVRKDVMDTWFDKEGYATWGLAVQRLERDAKLILKPAKEVDKATLRESLEKKFTKKVTIDYLEWTKKQIGPLYGDPYLKLGRKKVPYTLTNVFDAMHRQSIKASQDLATFGPGKARAMGAKEFRTLAEVRKHKAALVSNDEFQVLNDEQDKKRESLTDGLAKYYQYKDWRGEVDVWASIDDSMKAVGIFLKSPTYKQTPGLMKGCLGRRGFKDVPSYVLKDAVEFAKTLRDMPTEYFEVKPERIVNIGEFSGAALPRNVDPLVKAILKKHGVPFKIYKTEAERQAVTASFQRKKGVLFAKAPAPLEALTIDTVKAEIVEKIGSKSLDSMVKAGKINFVTIKEAAEMSTDPGIKDAQGFVLNGIVHLVPENINKGKVWNVLMHELGVHKGYEEIFGAKLAGKIFDTFVARRNEDNELGRAINRAFRRVPARTNRAYVNEEALAYFIEENANKNLSFARLIIARTRLWAVKYFGVKPDIFAHDDYIALAAGAIRGVAREVAEAPVREGVSREVFYSQEEQQEINKFSVPEMPVEEATREVTDNPNFVKWFGDSDIVDRKGRPLVVYHGTNVPDISIFEGHRTWFTPDASVAKFYADRAAFRDSETFEKMLDEAEFTGKIIEVDKIPATEMTVGLEEQNIIPTYLKIKNPLDLTDHGVAPDAEEFFNFLQKEGIVPKDDEFMDWDNELEVDEPSLWYMIEAWDLDERAKATGYDGIIIQDIASTGISHEAYVTFEPTQIKSIFNVGTFKAEEPDIRYSVAEQKDLRTWADDLIKSAKTKGVVLDKTEPSPERLKETSLSILAGLDLKKVSKPTKSFLEGMSPRGKGMGRVIEKWLASPEWYQHPVLKKIVDHSLNKSEKFHTTFNEFNAVDDPLVEHDTVAKTLEALARKGKISKAAFILGKTSADFKKLEILLDDADVYGEKHTTEELKEKGYSEDVVQAWSVVRESYDKQLEALIKPMKDLVARIKEQAAFMGTEPVYPDFGDFIIEGKKRRLTLQEAVMEMGRYKGTYSPRIREQGAWVVTGHIKKTVAEGGTEYFRNNRKTKSFANLLRDDLEKQGYTNVKVEKESRLPEETFQAVRMAEMGTMIGHAASKGLDKYDGEQQMAFMDEIILASADMIKSRGARATMIRRREGLAVKGYLTDPLKRFVRYTGTNAAGIAKAEMAQKMIKSLYGEYKDGKRVGGIDSTKEGEVHSMARAYIEEQLRNAEAGDRIVGIMKALTTFKFLGFNPRSVLVNLSSLTTSAPMALHTYAMDGKGSLLRIGKMLSVGCKDYTKVMAGKRLKDIDEQTFIDEFRDAGYTDAQYTRDAMGNVRGAYGTAWSKAMGGSMYVFGKSEEWVRGGTALTAFRLAKKQGLNNRKAKEKAILATAKAHGTYGKETLPMVAWGKGVGRLGQAFYTYMKFPHNYLQMLYDTGVRKHNIKGVIFGMAAPAVLGGIAAVPMYSTVMAIANALMAAIGDDRDAEKLVYDTINEHMGKGAEEIIRGGVLGLVDLDISGSLSMGPGSIPRSLFELTGAVGGMAQDIYRGGKFAVEGEMGRAFERLMPKVAGNIALAIRETREGATTSRGDRVWDEDGRPYMPVPSETVKRGLGFRSAGRAILAQSTWVSKREERRFKETASGIYRKIKYQTAGAENVIINKETSDKISEYNKNALLTSNVSLITPASVERQMERMKTPTTKQKARVTGCERAATFEGDIWAGALGITDELDKTQTEVKRLSDTGILKYSAPPSRNINAGYGVKVKLDDDRYSRYVADTTSMIKEATDRLILHPKWQGWTDKQRAFMIKRVINEGRKIVRDRLKITILRARLKKE